MKDLKNRFFKVPNSIFTDSRIESKSDIVMLLLLMRYCNRSGFTKISIETICQQTRCTKKTVIASLRTLEEKRIIDVFRKHNHCSTYKIIWKSEVENNLPGGALFPFEGAKEPHDKDIYLNTSLKDDIDHPIFEEENLEEREPYDPYSYLFHC